MNKYRPFIFVEIGLGILALVLAVLMLTTRGSDSRGKVAVIVPNSDAESWDALKYGLKMAAADQNVDMFVVDTPEHLSVRTQQSLMKQAILGGADALVVAPVSGEKSMAGLKNDDRQVPVIALNEPVESDSPEVNVVANDPEALGSALTKLVAGDYKQHLTGETIGILASDRDQLATTRILEKLQIGITQHGALIRWTMRETKAALDTLPPVDIVIALDDAATVAAGSAVVDDAINGARVYGVGCSTEALHQLDSKAVAGLVVPDDFNRGYQSLVVAAKQLSIRLSGPKRQVIGQQTLRRPQLFTQKNQTLLFMMNDWP